MNIVVAGASGMIGRALVGHLRGAGHAVVRLVRREPANADERPWNPVDRVVPAEVAAADAVVNLSGADIAGARWTAHRRAVLRMSRLDATLALASALRAAPRRRVLVNASAVGFYGDGGDAWLTEASPSGEGLLAGICRDWEDAAHTAEGDGTRVVCVRFGVVLAAQGGALRRLLPLFRLGVGGRLGSGRQWMSWIALADAVGALAWAVEREGVAGPLNAVAPEAVTNATFTATLARVLHRPAFLPVPAAALRLAFGQMAQETLLAGARVEPEVLRASGYPFRFPRLEDALVAAVARPPAA